MQAQVKEWGNSQGIRLSKEVLKSAGIKLNEFLDVEVSDGVITLARQFRHKTLEDRAAEYDGKLMLDGEYDWRTGWKRGVVMASLHQGDILKVEKIKYPVLVVSKDFFNTSGEIIGCPIIKNSTAGPLHIWMSTEENEGYIQCEKLALLDMSFRGYKKVDRLPISEMVNISDAIQGIFEYV